MAKTMVKQAVPLQPMEDHQGAETYLQPMEEPMLEQLLVNFSTPTSWLGWGSHVITECASQGLRWCFKQWPGLQDMFPASQSLLPPCFVSSANLLRVHSISVCVIEKDIEEYQSQDRTLRDTTHHQPPPGHRAIDHNSLVVSIQPVPYLSNSPSIKSMSLQFGDKDIMWDCIKGLTEV
ncbi:hypothetical protein BTVI_01097 [Pitangus sulphuratus]|nr:hypothetical protein BTVI_01097 [Pitangus sulphuratus]